MSIILDYKNWKKLFEQQTVATQTVQPDKTQAFNNQAAEAYYIVNMKQNIKRTLHEFVNEQLKQESMNYNNIIIDFFTGMRGIHDLFESIYEGLYGGVQRYKVEPNEGNFDKDFLIKFIKINQGDNDFDYELGRIGYRFLTSDEGLKELSKFYLDELKTYKHEYVSIDVIENCKKSLINIINS